MKLIEAAFVVWLLLPCGLFARQAPSDLSKNASYQDSDDISWVQQTGLSLRNFQALRRTAGIADTNLIAQIEAVDAKTLPHGRILFVSSFGTGHCLNVGVYERHGKDFFNVWPVARPSDDLGICRELPCKDPVVRATKKGSVIIEAPLRDETADMGECDHIRVFTYVPAGKGYQLASEKTANAYCNPDTYHWALDIVFGEHADSGRIATVQLLPSSQKESAIAFDMTSSGLSVSRLSLKAQLWTQFGIFVGAPKTPSQCIAVAMAASVEKTPLPLPKETAQRLIDELGRMDFVSYRCPRESDGTCGYVEDGTRYTVEYKDRPSIQLTDVSASGMRSENPALSNWVSDLLKIVASSGAQDRRR